MANNATANITVTKKPRYIHFMCNNTTLSTMFGILDIERQTAYRYAYWQNAFHNEVWTSWQSYVTSVTDSTVSIRNVYGGACLVIVGVYY